MFGRIIEIFFRLFVKFSQNGRFSSDVDVMRYLLSSLVYGHSPLCIYAFMRRVVTLDSRLAGSKRITDLSLPGKKHISCSLPPSSSA